MHAPLIRLAATVARGDAPVVVFGLDDAPVLDATVGAPLLAVPEAAARHLVGLLGRGDTVSDAVLAAESGADAEALADAVAVLLPGRGAGWTTTDAAVLAAALEGRFGAVLVTGRPGGLARSPLDLDAILRRALGLPLFTGWLPPDDALAPGCPVAILQPLPDAPEPPVTALLRVRDDAATLEPTLRWLTGEGIDTIVLDGGSADGTASVAEGWLGRGVVSVVRGGTEAGAATLAETIAPEVERGWLLRLAANERVEGPWPDIGLRRTLGRFAAAGWGTVAATTLHVAPGPGDDGRGDFGRGPRPWRFALPDPNARPTAWLTGDEPVRRSPYNLLVRSYPVGQAAERASGWPTPSHAPADWEPWDEAAQARYLVERLTGHGIFRSRYPTPPECLWSAEERLLEWDTSLLAGDLGRLPYPDPLAPEAGIVRIRWTTPDDAPASLFVAPEDGDEQLGGRGGRGTVTVESVEPNRHYVARLYADESRSRLLGELRFGVRMEIGP